MGVIIGIGYLAMLLISLSAIIPLINIVILAV
jgi:hypothetical protein